MKEHAWSWMLLDGIGVWVRCWPHENIYPTWYYFNKETKDRKHRQDLVEQRSQLEDSQLMDLITLSQMGGPTRLFRRTC